MIYANLNSNTHRILYTIYMYFGRSAAVIVKANTFDLGRSGCGDTLVIEDVTNGRIVFDGCANEAMVDQVEIKYVSTVYIVVS